MSYGFKVMIEGDYALFSRPELKVERASYDVPPPGALEGLLKSVYWKPPIRYVIDQIVVFNPIRMTNIRRNEVKDKVSYAKVKRQMKGEPADVSVYTGERRNQRASMVLKNVKYGVAFHFELTGIKDEEETDGENKHYCILKRRLERGQRFRTPCLGCAEFPVKSITLVDHFDMSQINQEILAAGDVDLGWMSYRLNFEDKGMPINGDWERPKFSDRASGVYYRPHMIGGVIDVEKYREELTC